MEAWLMMLLLPLTLFLVVVVFVVIVVGFILPRHTNSSKKLPPGSMGWPYIGETLQLYCNSENPNSFFSRKQRRYGEIFKTHILGCPCVMIASPDAFKLVLVSNAHLFKPTYPSSKEQLIGSRAIFYHDGPYHARLRKVLLSSLAPKSICSMTYAIDDLVVSTLKSWEGKIINTFMEMKKFTLKVGILTLFGNTKDINIDKLHEMYIILENGYNSIPINIRGTKYHNAMKAREYLSETIKALIHKRMHKGIVENDLLGNMLTYKGKKGDQGFTEKEIIDNVIGILFASRDTTASVLTWIIKYLKSNPNLLDSVIMEQDQIRHAKSGNKEKLTWVDTKNMLLTTRVIQETLRVASIISFTFREAIQDVEYKGYVIPRGWKVLPLFRSIHYNSDFFQEPDKFDPSRFEVPQKPNTFLPFGNGLHSCPGSELAKLEILIFIHHLTTKFSWELYGLQNNVQYSPFLIPEGGLPIKVSRRL